MRVPWPLAALLVPLLLAGCLDSTVSVAVEPGDRLARGVTDDVGWPALEDATIRPGVKVQALRHECISNFVFMRPDNTSIFLGVSSFCVEGMRIGELLLVDPGRSDAEAMLIYSSWITMAEIGTTDPAAREYNDFAVLRISPQFRHLVHPAILGHGGPVGVADAGALATGDEVLTYGPALDGAPTRFRQGVVTGRVDDWALLVHGAPPMLPGSMGSAVLTPDGRAVGITVNLGVAPNPGANGVARLDAVMAYALEHANLIMDLATWELLPEGPFAAAHDDAEPGVADGFNALTT